MHSVISSGKGLGQLVRAWKKNEWKIRYEDIWVGKVTWQWVIK